MATFTVSGYTAEEVEKAKEEWDSRDRPTERAGAYRNEFEESHCLAKIPRQPDDYDGPPRYCMSTNLWHNSGRCKHHGGAGGRDGDELDKLAAMKHGMNATREHLIEDFSEKDEALYDFIVDGYAESYDIDAEGDPAAAYDLHRLAAEIVRAERGRGYLLKEGEVREKKVRDDGGRIVVDKNGEVVTEKSEHYLAQMMHRQDKKITDLEKELGVTRKEQLRQDNSDTAVEAFKNFAEVGKTILDRESRDFDGEEEPWQGDNAAE